MLFRFINNENVNRMLHPRKYNCAKKYCSSTLNITAMRTIKRQPAIKTARYIIDKKIVTNYYYYGIFSTHSSDFCSRSTLGNKRINLRERSEQPVRVHSYLGLFPRAVLRNIRNGLPNVLRILPFDGFLRRLCGWGFVGLFSTFILV